MISQNFLLADWYGLEDVRYMAATIYGEARGEPLSGQVAVGYVILNRAKRRDKSIKDIVLEPYQFSCWNERDPNRMLVEKIINDWDSEFKRSQVLRQCWLVSVGVISGCIMDYSQGATHYIARWLYFSDKCPDWAHRMRGKAYIGEHIFLG